MSTHAVIYDACVLYPAPLRDFLLHLALTRRFRARWTDQIHREWIEAVQADRPDIDPASLESCAAAMDAAIPDCLVTGYELIVEGLELPDPDDRHVLAAAIRTNAAAIVTFNLRDFPEDRLHEFSIEAVHPDDFIIDLIDSEPALIEAVAKRQRAMLQNPTVEVEQFVSTLEKLGLPQVASFLRDRIDLI